MQNEFKIVPITNKNIIDMTGETYGRLTVLGLSDKKPGANWLCQCTCGKKTVVSRYNLTSGTTSCGCYAREQSSKKNTSHGESHTRLYRIHTGMKERCNNPNSNRYSAYGARGIEICPEWEESYVAFADWARANGYQDNLSIDRIDNDGNYEPSNCRWVTAQEQAENTRQTVMVEYNDETRTLVEWSRITGLNVKTLRGRYYRGDRGDKLFRPTGNNGSINIEYNDETHNLTEWSRITGLNVNTLRDRYNRGDRGDKLFRPTGR